MIFAKYKTLNIETQNAIDKVRDNNKAYYLVAYEFAALWVKKQFKTFSSEDLKEDFYAAGYPKPKEPRVFGAVMTELKKNQLIKFHSYQSYKNPSGHSRPSTVWISTEYSLLQSEKRKTNFKTQARLDFPG